MRISTLVYLHSLAFRILSPIRRSDQPVALARNIFLETNGTRILTALSHEYWLLLRRCYESIW